MVNLRCKRLRQSSHHAIFNEIFSFNYAALSTILIVMQIPTKENLLYGPSLSSRIAKGAYSEHQTEPPCKMKLIIGVAPRAN